VTVTFHLPGPLRQFADGRTQVQVDHAGGSLLEALTALTTAFPGLGDRILNEQGRVREHVNIFVGNEDSRYTGGLATKVSDGAEISIVPSISGGSPTPHLALATSVVER
jgi:molybdopterin converting factor small subunit